MSKICGKALLLASLSLLAYEAPLAQSGSNSPTKPPAQLKMVVIFSRHGVRSSTWTPDRLNRYSAQPWPNWNVPPGNLTTRGHQLLTQFGNYDRAALVATGLFSASGCNDTQSTYIWADTDQRTIESGQALAEGLAPGCKLPLHGLAEGENDPLFHSTANSVKPADSAAAFAELTKLPAKLQQTKLIEQLNRVLRGCSPDIACTPVHTPGTSLPDAPTAPLRGKGDHLVDLQGPLPLASSFAEDLLLEYADGMPLENVGWGKVDEAQLSQFLTLHSIYFDLMHRTPVIAKIEASNMLFHIARTLQQGVDRQPVEGAIGPVGTKLVMLVGHDTNLAAIASLLGVHWHLDGRDDDTPPGTQLAFELWQDSNGVYSVRVTVAMQTLRQLRDMPALTTAAPPARQTLSLPTCQTCEWENFRRLTNAAINNNNVFPMKTPNL